MVRHLSPDTSERTLSRIFSKHGDLEKCRHIRDVISGLSKRYAFVEYKHESDARKALRESKDLMIDDKHVTVDFECERLLTGWKPRRFGGGFGGKKESGQLRFGGVERPFRRPISLNSKSFSEKSSTSKRDFNTANDRSRQNSYNNNRRTDSSHDGSESYPKRHRR